MSSANERFSSYPRTERATIVQKVVTMPILVATDREVVVIDFERGTSASARGESATVLLASLRTRSSTGGHGVGLTATGCSGALMAGGPGGLLAWRAG